MTLPSSDSRKKGNNGSIWKVCVKSFMEASVSSIYQDVKGALFQLWAQFLRYSGEACLQHSQETPKSRIMINSDLDLRLTNEMRQSPKESYSDVCCFVIHKYVPLFLCSGQQHYALLIRSTPRMKLGGLLDAVLYFTVHANERAAP